MNLRTLREDVADRLLRSSLTNPAEILQLSKSELQKVGNFTDDDVKKIFYLASESIIGRLDQALEGPKCMTVGCPVIDSVLGGGLWISSGINELSGESGCGKTQFCLQLALTAQNPVSVRGIDKCSWKVRIGRISLTLASAVLYICTEDSFPSKRLLQLMNNIQRPFKNVRELPYGDRIFVEHIADVKGLKNCIISRLPVLLKIKNSIGLVIIDSIAAVFRADYALFNGAKRTKDLRCIGCQLHSLSRKYGLGVLCVNQVTASMNNENTSVPALGLAWANLVTTRIVMKKSMFQNTKKLELVFSPHHEPSSCDYVINEYGVQGVT